MFHMYVGVRAGGGIGDQIEDPAGDEYEIYRIIFDITFFFFVIVILLAIIQGEMHTYLDTHKHLHMHMHTHTPVCSQKDDIYTEMPQCFLFNNTGVR